MSSDARRTVLAGHAARRYNGAMAAVDDRRRALRGDSFTGVSRAARDLGLAERTVRRAVLDGQIPAYVVSKRTRLKVADVRAWLERCRRPSGGRPG